jgi:hypothetical protein
LGLHTLFVFDERLPFAIGSSSNVLMVEWEREFSKCRWSLPSVLLGNRINLVFIFYLFGSCLSYVLVRNGEPVTESILFLYFSFLVHFCLMCLSSFLFCVTFIYTSVFYAGVIRSQRYVSFSRLPPPPPPNNNLH